MTDARPSLRVGMVCPYSFDVPGGVQNHVLGLARYLRQAGHRPYVLAPGELGHSAGDLEDFASVGAAMPVPYNGSVARVNFGPLSAARVRRWLRIGRFDLIHIHEPITPSISLLTLWAAERPIVATFHTATPRSRSMRLAGGVLRAAIEKIDAGIAVSESATQRGGPASGSRCGGHPQWDPVRRLRPGPDRWIASAIPAAEIGFHRPARRAAQGARSAARRSSADQKGSTRPRGDRRRSGKPAAPSMVPQSWHDQRRGQDRASWFGRRFRRAASGSGKLWHCAPGGHGERGSDRGI